MERIGRLRFVATLIDIVFSAVLVMVQMGLYLGFGRMVTTMIDHAPADLCPLCGSTADENTKELPLSRHASGKFLMVPAGERT